MTPAAYDTALILAVVVCCKWNKHITNVFAQPLTMLCLLDTMHNSQRVKSTNSPLPRCLFPVQTMFTNNTVQ